VVCFASSVGARTTAAAQGYDAGRFASADAGYGPHDAPGGPGGDMHHHSDGPERMARRLRDVLQLTPAQEPALQAFLAAMHPPRQGPQGLDEMAKHMQDQMARRQAEMQARIAAIKQFYAALTPAQQKAFDALHGGMMGGMGREHGGWGGRHGGMHMGMMDEPLPPMPPMPPRLAMRALPSMPPAPPAPPPPQ
jgi:hypothetical protein